MYRILVIDDEYGILEVVQAYLLNEGFEVYTAGSGQKGLELLNQISPDLVVLDLMLPDLSGEDVCRALRQKSEVPVIMLTAKKEEQDRILGLELGADDYLVKPFSTKELIMRIQAILRRVYGQQRVERSQLSFNGGQLVLDRGGRQLFAGGEQVELTRNEYELLNVLMRYPHQTFSREQLIEAAFGSDYSGYDRTVDVYVKNLRKKIEPDAKAPNLIVTVYGIGYKFTGERDA